MCCTVDLHVSQEQNLAHQSPKHTIQQLRINRKAPDKNSMTLSADIYTIIKTTSEFRNVSLMVAVTAVGMVEVGVVDTHYSVSQPAADAER